MTDSICAPSTRMGFSLPIRFRVGNGWACSKFIRENAYQNMEREPGEADRPSGWDACLLRLHGLLNWCNSESLARPPQNLWATLLLCLSCLSVCGRPRARWQLHIDLALEGLQLYAHVFWEQINLVVEFIRQWGLLLIILRHLLKSSDLFGI